MKFYNKIIKQGLRAVAPGGRFGKLQILVYHRVLPFEDPLRPWEVTSDQFLSHMQTLKKYYNVLNLSDALKKLKNRTLPPQAVVITFDDGYEDNVTEALPILQAFKFKATFFLTTGFLNQNIMFNDQIIEYIRQQKMPLLDLKKLGLGQYQLSTDQQKAQACVKIINEIKHYGYEKRQRIVEQLLDQSQLALPSLMMGERGVKLLKNAGMEIGAHTVTHPILSKLSDDQAYHEIAKSKETLEGLINKKVRYFAYPNGFPNRDYLPTHCKIVKKLGFEAACSTWWGAANVTTDLFQLPRFTPWDKKPMRFVYRMSQYRRTTKGEPLVV